MGFQRVPRGAQDKTKHDKPWFFSDEMKTGRQMCRTVGVYFLRPLIFSKEMHARNQLVRDVPIQRDICEMKKRIQQKRLW